MTKLIEVVGSLKDGGAETLVKDYVSLIDQDRFQVMVLCISPMKKAANYSQVAEKKIKIISVYRNYNFITRALNKILGRWYVPIRFAQILRQENPNCIHIHSPIAGYFAKIRSALKDIKLVYTCHSEPDRYFLCGEKGEAQAVQKLVGENGMRLIALHDDMRLALNERFGVDNTVVINNGVDFKRYKKPEWNVDRIREQIGVPQDAFLVIHVGRFAPVKNHSFLLEVFCEIKKLKPKAHLLLVGDGPLRAAISEQIGQKTLKDEVTMLAHRSDVPELLYASDLMVFPSIYEGLSVVLVETQVTGLRCIVSDSINKANFLTEKTIPVSLQQSPKEWARIALTESVTNPSFGDIQKFDLAQEIRRLEAVYSE